MRTILLALLLGAGAPGVAATVTSPAPDRVAVTVYRDPNRSRGALDLRWLNGFALVTERRRMMLPAGLSTIRFEGVAEGIVPVSAIVTGLPGGVIEKNRDARLLSPAALIEGSLGRRVTLRRTDRASGRTREADAIVRAAGDDGVVVETREGIEALGCSGLAEKPAYGDVPAGLSAKPTLSVQTRSADAGAAEVTLSYLATGFDWEASYVARIAADGRTLDLFAWLTLANGNGEMFADADLQAVAGTLDRETAGRLHHDMTAGLTLHCWPQDITSTAPVLTIRNETMGGNEDIVVTAMRMAAPVIAPGAPQPPPPPPPPPPVAGQEELGDLKLYRLPERFTIGARSQKQVTLLTRSNVPFARVYAFDAGTVRPGVFTPATIRLRMKNETVARLGLPLPGGTVALFARGQDAEARVVGGGRLRDLAIGEELELSAGPSAQVRLVQTEPVKGRWTAEISNANPYPVDAEVQLMWTAIAAGTTLAMKGARPLWSVRVPANGRAALSYRLAEAGVGGADRPAPRR